MQHQEEPPSIFENGYQGLLAGAVVGLGGGYLKARKGGFHKHDWRAIGLGIGIGALSGAALGIVLGIADRGGAPAARYIARDLSLGAGFGLVVGVIAGGISAAVKSEPKHVLVGGAIGVIAGAGTGILTGIIEGQAKKRRNLATTARRRLQIAPTVTAAASPDGLRVSSWLPGVAGRF